MTEPKKAETSKAEPAKAEKVKPAVKKAEPAQAKPKQEVVAIQPCRLPYHPALKEQFDVDPQMWRLLCESIFPGAQTIEGIALAVRYCQSRGLDILKRPVHIVPVYNARLKKTVELVWQGIGEYRTTASRTGEYGGCEATECGPLMEQEFEGFVDRWENNQKISEQKKTIIRYHEWMRVTVYRIIKGTRCPFPGPKVYFQEIYSRIKHNVEVPNERWQKSPNGMLEKCAEAAALRKAFPEVGDVTAEEMEGKTIEAEEITVLPKVTPQQVKEQVDQHMQEVGTNPTTEPQPGEVFTESSPTATKPIPRDEAHQDWYSKIDDEIAPGINNCKTQQEVVDLVNESIDLINSMPKPVKAHLDGIVGKKLKQMQAKNGH